MFLADCSSSLPHNTHSFIILSPAMHWYLYTTNVTVSQCCTSHYKQAIKLSWSLCLRLVNSISNKQCALCTNVARLDKFAGSMINRSPSFLVSDSQIL